MKIDIIISPLKKYNIKSRHFNSYRNIEEYNDICNIINFIDNSIPESKDNSIKKY